MPLATKTRRPVKAARAPLQAAPAPTAPADPCAPGGRCAKCKTSGGIFHLPTCVACLTRCGPGKGGVNPLGGGTSWASIAGKLPRYLEVAGGGAVILTGLVVLVVSATGGTPKVPGVSALAALRTKTEPSASRNVRYAARRRAETPEVDTTTTRSRAARLSAQESMAVRRAQEARRARAEAKLTESYLPKRRRVGGATVERPRGRSPVASRPVRSST